MSDVAREEQLPQESASAKGLPRGVLAVARVLLGIALLAYALGKPDALRGLRTILTTPWILPAVFACSLLGAVFESFRLGVLYGAHDFRLPFRSAFRVVAIGALFNVCIPGGTGGDVMKLYYLTGGVAGRRIEAGTLLLFDRVVALFSLLCVFAALLPFAWSTLRTDPLLSAGAWACSSALVGLPICAILATSRRLASDRLLDRVARWPLGVYAVRAYVAVRAFRGRKRALAQAILLSMAGHCLLVTLFLVAGKAAYGSPPYATVCVLSLLGLLVNALPLTPGGIGVGEAAFNELFARAGLGLGAPLVLSWRAAQIPLLLLGGLFWGLGLQRGSILVAEKGERDPRVC